MIGRVGLVNFNLTFSLSLVLYSHRPKMNHCEEFLCHVSLASSVFSWEVHLYTDHKSYQVEPTEAGVTVGGKLDNV